MNKTHVWYARVAYFVAFLCLTACGTESKKGEPNGDAELLAEANQSASPAVETPYDVMVTPPKEYYSQLLFDDAARLDEGLELAATVTPQILYVNFDGVTLKKGFGQGQSFILCKAEATIPAATINAAERASILQMVAKHYETAGAKLLVTDKKPTSGDVTMMVVGGSYGTLGCFGAGVLGVAPFDVGNKNRNDIGFAFMPNGVTPKVIAETIAHEAGHSFGLDHVVDRKDIMYPSSSSQVEKFGVARVSGGTKVQDEPAILAAVLGAFDGSNMPGGSATPAPQPTPSTPTPQQPGNNGNKPIPGGVAQIPNVGQIPGLDKLADIAKLLPILGGAAGLDISQLLPLLQGLIPNAGAGNLPGLDKVLQLQQLLAALNGGNLGAGTLAGLPGLDFNSMFALVQGLIGNQNALSALADLLKLGQNQNIAALLQNLLKGGLAGGAGNILGGLGGAAGGAAGQIPGLPDLSQILNIPKGSSSSALVGQFRSSAQFVQTNYVGDERDALLSLLKVAYAQAMAQSAP